MPEPVKDIYLEAASIIDASPRAAAALMRLALEELCRGLGTTGDLNEAIGSLVKSGLRLEIQKALDVVRVTGNSAIHPGSIDQSDTRERASAMFSLLNMIVDDRISRPKQIEEMYASLPDPVRDQIERRDARSKGAGKPANG
jgi:hypothetical protein